MATRTKIFDRESTVSLLASDLAGAKIDYNEAAKALAYLRAAERPQQFFQYLDQIIRNGHIVIRSNQTLDYYRDLRTACKLHLSDLSIEDMRYTLGWAIRLLRYYRLVPETIETRTQIRATHPTKPPIPTIGDIITGLVLERDDHAVVIEIPKFDHEQALGVLKVEPDTPQWRSGKDTARVEVIGSRQQGKRTILELKRGPKREES